MATPAELAALLRDKAQSLTETQAVIQNAADDIVTSIEDKTADLQSIAALVQAIEEDPSSPEDPGLLGSEIGSKLTTLDNLSAGVAGAPKNTELQLTALVIALGKLADRVEKVVAKGGDPEPEPVQKVTTRAISLDLSAAVTSGDYVSGSAWLKAPAPITKITPGVVVEGTRTKNGAMVNPDSYSGQAQGYDSAMYAQYKEAGSYDPSENVGAQLPYTLKAGESLICSISDASPSARPTVRTMEVFTGVSDVPPADSFRPPYAGQQKPIYRESDMAPRSQLPAVEVVPPTEPWTNPGQVPTFATTARMVERPYADDCLSEWPGRYRRAADNMQDYGRDMATQIGVACLRMATAGTDAEKRATDLGLVQAGIDMMGILKNGGSWPPREGHFQGRLLLILYAGMRLNNAEMLKVVSDYPRATFSELCQTAMVNGVPVWEQRLCTQPGRPPNGYDICCTGNSFTVMALAIQLLGLEAALNYPAFMNYAQFYFDRIWSKLAGLSAQEREATFYELCWGPWGEWVAAMWQKYWVRRSW